MLRSGVCNWDFFFQRWKVHKYIYLSTVLKYKFEVILLCIICTFTLQFRGKRFPLYYTFCFYRTELVYICYLCCFARLCWHKHIK